jgi:hypothetical protein
MPETPSDVQVMVCCEPAAKELPAIGEVMVIVAVTACPDTPRTGTRAAVIKNMSVNAVIIFFAGARFPI